MRSKVLLEAEQDEKINRHLHVYSCEKLGDLAAYNVVRSSDICAVDDGGGF